MANIFIPKNKILRLHRNGVSVTGNIPIIIEEDYTLSLSSKFSSLMDTGKVSKLGTLLGGIIRDVTKGEFGFSGQFKEMGFQIWDSTDPVYLSGISVNFYMGSTNLNSAYEEVYRPALELMKLPLPDDASVTKKGIGLVPPGPSLLDVLYQTNTGKTLSVEIGKIVRINRVIVTKAEPTFSAEEDDQGYPIWCKMVLDIESLFTATVQTLDPTVGGTPLVEDVPAEGKLKPPREPWSDTGSRNAGA